MRYTTQFLLFSPTIFEKLAACTVIIKLFTLQTLGDSLTYPTSFLIFHLILLAAPKQVKMEKGSVGINLTQDSFTDMKLYISDF